MNKLYKIVKREDYLLLTNNKNSDRLSISERDAIKGINSDFEKVGLFRIANSNISIRKYEDEWFTIFNSNSPYNIIADGIDGVIEYLKDI